MAGIGFLIVVVILGILFLLWRFPPLPAEEPNDAVAHVSVTVASATVTVAPTPYISASPDAETTIIPDLPSASPSPAGSASANVSPTAKSNDRLLAPDQQPAVDLPFFGIAMRRIADEYGLAQAQEAGVPVVRYGPLAWDEVEPERMDPASYRWEAVQDFEQDLIRAAQAGIDVMLFVHSTPDWAQAIPGHSCGPIAEDSLDEFARFLQAAVARYSQPPFNVKYWELFNEPDVDPALVRPDSEFGCWGDKDDEYYGGKRFARMLESVFAAIKEADPRAQVILGGLLLDAPDTDAATFLAGVLEAGGGDYFDILAFHAYTFYSPDFYNWSTLPGGKWNDRGGVVIGKADFLRQMLDSYGYEKPIILNEAGLAWFGKEKPSEDYRQAQADYVVKLFARGLALQLGHISWYGWQGPGWRHMGLLLNDLSPTPAYHAYVFAMQQLDRVEYLGPVDYPGTEGYTFRRNDGLLQVIWSADGTSYPVSVPSIRFLSAFDGLGQPVRHDLLPDGYLFDVRRPIYLLLAPEQ